jgi:hypothetical protein
MTLKCMIGGVDVASSLMAFSLPNPGIGRIGAATLTFRRQTGGLTSILPMRDVQIYDVNGGGEITKRWFGGLVAIPKRTNTAATVHWEVECQDYNHLLHSINNNAAAATGYTIPLGSFAVQIASAVTQWQQMGYGAVNTAIDATSQVDNLVATNIPAHGPYKGVSLGYVIQQICNEAQRINSALRPRFFMGLSEDILGGAPFGPPNLVVYDAAAVIASTYTFSDTPTGAERHIYNFSKIDDAATLVNRRQLMYNENLVTTYEDTTSGTDYPNPYQNHGLASNKGYWTAEPLSGMTFTSTAAADAYIERHVKQLAYPLTTIEFDVDVDLTVIPGTVHYIEHSAHSVAGQYRCVGVDVTMSEDMPEVAYVHCVFGARRLELFEDGEEIFEPPVLGGGLPPDPPTSPVLVSNIYDPQLRQAAVRTSVTASVSSDVAGYEVMWSDGFSGSLIDVGLVTNRVIYTRPGSSYSVQWRAYDHERNVSTWTVALTGTSASREAPRSLLWGDFEGLFVSDATSPEGWTLTTSGVATITIDTTTANVYTGKRSLKMVGAAGATCTATSDFIAVAPGTFMSWRLPAKGSIAGAYLVGQVSWYDAAEAFISTSTITVAGGEPVSTSYFPFSTGVQVPAGAALARFIVTNDGAPVGTLWVDGLQFFPAAVDADLAADIEINTTGGITSSGNIQGDSAEFNQLIANSNAFLNGDAIFGDRLVYGAGFAWDVTETNVNFTLSAGHQTVLVDASGGSRTITLPTAASSFDTTHGRIYMIKKVDSSVNKVTVDADGSETIDGLTTYPLGEQYQSVTIQSTGTAWRVIGQAGLMLISDGTRWLGPKITIPLHNYVGAAPFTATTEALAGGSLVRDVLITDWNVGRYVGSVNSGVSYWNIILRRLSSAVSISNLSTITTQNDAPDVWLKEPQPTLSGVILYNSDVWVQLYLEKIGTPGSIYVQSTVQGREIYT